MTEREYPRWVHGEGRASIVAHSADEEAAILDRWGAPSVAPIASVRVNALTGERPLPGSVAPRKAGWPKGKPRTAKHAGMN